MKKKKTLPVIGDYFEVKIGFEIKRIIGENDKTFFICEMKDCNTPLIMMDAVYSVISDVKDGEASDKIIERCKKIVEDLEE